MATTVTAQLIRPDTQVMPTKSSNSSTLFPPGRWAVDPSNSSVSFRVRHFGVATVHGRFARFTGTIDEHGVEGAVDAASVQTGHSVRDARLRSPDFFDADHFPRIAFEAKSSTDGTLTGQLTIRDITRPVTLKLTPGATQNGAPVVRAKARISRKAFALDWSALVEAGQLIVSDHVDLLLDVTLVPA